jgi:DNA polymerase
MPAASKAMAKVREEAAACTRCPLYRLGTQTVFGEGRVPCSVMLVGEQPGDQEDLQGRPFVGPAGRILDRALAQAGIDRSLVYVTNAVKHFKHVPRGKRRIHQRPNAGEIGRCKWWLDLELKLVRPTVVVALGATAARALLGRPTQIQASRGRELQLGPRQHLVVTTHPSSLLRLPDSDAKALQLRRLVADLALAARLAPAVLQPPSDSSSA